MRNCKQLVNKRTTRKKNQIDAYITSFSSQKKAVNTVKAVKIYKGPKISEYYIYTYIL